MENVNLDAKINEDMDVELDTDAWTTLRTYLIKMLGFSRLIMNCLKLKCPSLRTNV